MNVKTKKALIKFAVFIFMTVVYGAFMGLLNHWLRENGWNVKALLPILIVSAVYVYYLFWRRLCKSIDSISKKEQ